MAKHNTTMGMHSKVGVLLTMACEATPDACSVWPYGVGSRGLPHLSWRGRAVVGTRVIGQLYHGDHVAFKQVCGNRRCVNPYHVLPGQRGTDMRSARAARKACTRA